MSCGSSNNKNGAHRPQAQAPSKQKGQEVSNLFTNSVSLSLKGWSI
jgi:hypothetical protein